MIYVYITVVNFFKLSSTWKQEACLVSSVARWILAMLPASASILRATVPTRRSKADG